MKKISNVRNLTFIALMSALICILSPWSINIPISPVPIAFANLAIYIAVFTIGWKKATISTIIYLLIGMVGVPVFSNFGSGIGKLLGPTGGYLIGYIFVTVVGGYLIDRFYEKKWMRFLGLVIGTVILYAFGTVWLIYVMKMSFIGGLWAGVIPYIPGDLIKMLIAVLLGSTIRSQLIKAGLFEE